MHAHSDINAGQAPGTWQQRIASVLSSITGSGKSSSSSKGSVEQDLEFIHRWNAECSTSSSSSSSSCTSSCIGMRLHVYEHQCLQQTTLFAYTARCCRSLRNAARLEPFKRALRDEQLPASVDWRGTPADGPVKDQASCGSCWAFASAGAMTGGECSKGALQTLMLVPEAMVMHD
eukprot:scaffold88945_cov19-Tisochrysis_lutea.AAC.1